MPTSVDLSAIPSTNSFEDIEIPQILSPEGEPSPYFLLNEITPDIQREIDFIDAIQQGANRKARREATDKAMIGLQCCEKTIKRKLKQLQLSGVTGLGAGRKNKGQFVISKQWFDFIISTYRWGQKFGSRTNRNQVHKHLIALTSKGKKLRGKDYEEKFKNYPEVLEDLVAGKHPSCPTVYKVIKCYLAQEERRVRHPGSPAERQIVQTTDGILVLTHSNQVWQIDHTKLDVLIVDENGEVIGRPCLTLVMDSYSGCVVGFYLGLEAAGSHEVALALRHAMLPKEYGPEYELTEKWYVYGIPDYVVTDRAREFKSEHMKLVSLQLGFQRRLRAFPSAGGLIETIFDKINKELLSKLPGYTGSCVEERPPEAEKSACITIQELEILLVRYFVDHYNRHTYGRGLAQPRIERWQTSLLLDPEELDERQLDICLLKVTRRKVEKYGCVNFQNLVYQGECLAGYQGEYICLRYDQRNVIRLIAYTYSNNGLPGEYIGIVEARDAEIQRLSLAALKWRKKKFREQESKIDQTALLSERLILDNFIETKRKSKRRRRKKAHEERAQETNQSKVVELFPQSQTPEESPQQDLNTAAPASLPEETVIESSDPVSPLSISPETVTEPSSQPKSTDHNPANTTKRSRRGIQDWGEFINSSW
jgi:putative transposase